MNVNPLRLGEPKRPTMKHRPAVWECMLGTVYAMNDDREIRYFGTDWKAALTFAGVDLGDDLRTHRPTRSVRWSNGRYPGGEPRSNQKVLWVTKINHRKQEAS